MSNLSLFQKHRTNRPRRKFAVLVAVLGTAAALAVVPAQAAFASGTAPGSPGADAYWDSAAKQGFATAPSTSSKVWYTVGDGEMQEAFYPQIDTPDTFGLQYLVSDGSSFTEAETTGTTHTATLVDSTSLIWQQTNTADNGDFTITKTYVSDPSRAVILIYTTVKNTSSSALNVFAQYNPALDNDGMGNTGGTDSTSGDLVADNGSYASALTSSAGFTTTNTGYAGEASDGQTEVTGSHALTTSYSSASTAGHISQTGEVESVAANSTANFTLALAFDSSEGAAVSDAAASLSTGFASLENTVESEWHSWLAGLTVPASVTGSGKLEEQYYVALMELKADEDKTYLGGFVASPTTPWGTSVSADSGGGHGYHIVWTRDEYEIASTLAAAGDSTDATAALNYLLQYEVTSSGWVKQNSFLNGTQVWGGTQMDQVADPIILAYQLGDTGSSVFATLKTEANYLVNNGPYTGEERWEENSGYSPATMAAEIAGLVCAAAIAADNGDTTDQSTWLAAADTFQSDLDNLTYTTAGAYGNGDYYLRINPDNVSANTAENLTLANGGGSYADQDIVDTSFLELVRLGVKAASSTEITNSITAVNDELEQTIPGYGSYWLRYNHDGYGETSSGGDYTGAGVGRLWPVLSGERGEYFVADGDATDAKAMLTDMANAANPTYQISEQIWDAASADGFTEGQPDNSATPLMWAMAQYVRLALDISAGDLIEQPAAVCQRYGCAGSTGTGAYTQTVKVIVPVNTAAAGETVYLTGDLSALGEGQADWSSDGIPMTQVSPTEWETTLNATSESTLDYKFDLGGSWSNVEKNADCADVGNRTLSVADGTTTVQVANWGGPNSCGDSTAVFDVTVPAGTPSGDTVYLSGNYDVLGTGIPASDDWVAVDYPMIQTGADTWSLTVTGLPNSESFQYKYDLGSWTSVEKTSSCADTSNRDFGFDTADASYPATDTVANWGGVGSCS